MYGEDVRTVSTHQNGKPVVVPTLRVLKSLMVTIKVWRATKAGKPAREGTGEKRVNTFAIRRQLVENT